MLNIDVIYWCLYEFWGLLAVIIDERFCDEFTQGGGVESLRQWSYSKVNSVIGVNCQWCVCEKEKRIWIEHLIHWFDAIFQSQAGFD